MGLEIFFDEKPGSVLDTFISLWIMNNYEHTMEVRRKFGVESQTSYDKLLYSLTLNNSVDKDKLAKYFSRDIEPHTIFTISSIWDYPNITDYLDYLLTLEEIKVRDLIINSLNRSLKLGLTNDNIRKIIKNTFSLLNYLKTLEIENFLKWEIFCLISDPNEYIGNFREFVICYLDTYKELENTRNSLLEGYNSYLKRNISELGIEFIKKEIMNRYNLDNYEEYYITTSINTSLLIKISPDQKKCYITIGPLNNEVIKNMHLENRLKNSLLMVKNIVEDTRFEIIKLLSNKDYYSQELAEILKLSKATVSHHMSYLMSLNIVTIRKDGQKLYYSLNKNLLKNSLNQIKDELELDKNS